MVRANSVTWKENLIAAFNKRTMVYDKRKIEDCSNDIWVRTGNYARDPDLRERVGQAAVLSNHQGHQCVVISGRIAQRRLKHKHNDAYTIGPTLKVNHIYEPFSHEDITAKVMSDF